MAGLVLASATADASIQQTVGDDVRSLILSRIKRLEPPHVGSYIWLNPHFTTAMVSGTEPAWLWTPNAGEVESIRIGLLLPPEERDANSIKQGVRVAVEFAHQVPGPKVEIVIRGRTGQWGTDGEEAGRMVLDDGVRGLIAPPGGAPSHLALQVAGRTATPVISLCPDGSVTRAGIPWMVRLSPSNIEEAQLIFARVKSDMTERVFRWSALTPVDRAGREAAKDLLEAAQIAGVHLNKPIQVSSRLGELPEVQKSVLASNPDGILLWLDPMLAGSMAKALRAAGFTGILAGPSRLDSANFKVGAGGAAEGFVMPSPMLDEDSRVLLARFTADYRRQFEAEPDLTARMAYDAGNILIEVLRKAGDHSSHQSFPLTSETPGASGRLKFDRSGGRIVPLELLEFRSGRFAPFAGKLTHK